jgi:hypothetical protein
MSDAGVRKGRIPRRLVWVLLACAGLALFVRVACYQRTLIETCTACLRDAPGRCMTSTSDTQIARKPSFNAREDAREKFGCQTDGVACTFRAMEDFVFTCQQKLVDLPPDWDDHFGRLSPR